MRRAAFISGSGKNIGRAIALELARRGVNVVVNGHSNAALCEGVAAEAKALGVEALVVMGDVGDAVTVRRIAAAALERFETIDILVNNAAVRPQQSFLEMSDDDWRRVLDVDLNASAAFARAFLPGMCAKGWGRIVNFTGMNAIMGSPGRAHVSTAKHGVWGLTKALAKEFGGKGVTANAISPGPIAGDREEWTGDHARQSASRIPLGRMGTPAEIAALCGLLCSDEGGYISGQMIAVNGAGTT